MTIQNPQLPSSVAQNLQQLTNVSAQNLGRTGQIVGMGIQNLAQTLSTWSAQQTHMGDKLAIEQAKVDSAKNIETYNRDVGTINGSDLTPEQKYQAIQDYTANSPLLSQEMSVYGMAYRDAGSAYWSNQAQSQAKAMAEVLKAKHGTNVDGFMAEWSALSSGMIAGAPTDELKLVTQKQLSKYGSDAFADIQTKHYETVRKRSEEGFKTTQKSLMEDYTQAKVNNDEAKAVSIMAQLTAVNQDGVNNFYISPEEASYTLKHLEKSGVIAQITGNFRGTTAEYQNFIKSKNPLLSPEEHQKIANFMAHDITQKLTIQEKQTSIAKMNIEMARMVNDERAIADVVVGKPNIEKAIYLNAKGQLSERALNYVMDKAEDKLQWQWTKSPQAQQGFKAMDMYLNIPTLGAMSDQQAKDKEAITQEYVNIMQSLPPEEQSKKAYDIALGVISNKKQAKEVDLKKAQAVSQKNQEKLKAEKEKPNWISRTFNYLQEDWKKASNTPSWMSERRGVE